MGWLSDVDSVWESGVEIRPETVPNWRRWTLGGIMLLLTVVVIGFGVIMWWKNERASRNVDFQQQLKRRQQQRLVHQLKATELRRLARQPPSGNIQDQVGRLRKQLTEGRSQRRRRQFSTVEGRTRTLAE